MKWDIEFLYMAEYPLSRKEQKIVRLADAFWQRHSDALSEDDINKINNQEISKAMRRILLPRAKEIVTSSFIIPVTSGAITCYMFANPRTQSMGQDALIVYFHGGGWTFGNMEFYNIYLEHLSSVTGAMILSIDYHLSPDNKFPTAVEDCYDALLWACGGAKYWKVDPDRIFIAGDCAGGNLAAVVAQLVRDRKGPEIAGQILLYPITDGRLRTLSIEEHKDTPMLTSRILDFYVDNYARESKDLFLPMFSPLLSQDKSRLAPALIINAEFDPLHDDGVLYAAELEKAGTSVKVFTAPSSYHGFMCYKNAKGRLESECAIRQFVSGRKLENIKFVTEKELKRINEAPRTMKQENKGEE